MTGKTLFRYARVQFLRRHNNYECDHHDLRAIDHLRYFRRRRYHARESVKPIDEFRTRQPCGSQSDSGHPSAQLGHFGQDRREEITGHAAYTQRGQICASVGE